MSQFGWEGVNRQKELFKYLSGNWGIVKETNLPINPLYGTTVQNKASLYDKTKRSKSNNHI